jgi:hypothetical protein
LFLNPYQVDSGVFEVKRFESICQVGGTLTLAQMVDCGYMPAAGPGARCAHKRCQFAFDQSTYALLGLHKIRQYGAIVVSNPAPSRINAACPQLWTSSHFIDTLGMSHTALKCAFEAYYCARLKESRPVNE